MKTLKIPTELHQALKVQAAKQGVSLMQLIVTILKKYLATLAIVLTLVSCASPRHYTTKVEEFGYDKIEHRQKIYIGQNKEEVLRNFGAPTRVQTVQLNFNNRVEIEYLYAVWCSYPSCRVYVDPETNKVTSYLNFRYEYTEELK